ncbi:B3 DNA binding domain containing protein [Parasponia andersonii]|uniref:B3 DNA binding domain containing protein n=1 Tax=Parasponia andersonii TaxID=3476 RepID=A0A2P5D735_PARAD|nr:B3 DNA binding domain containing protein [Parasponia andersonii]
MAVAQQIQAPSHSSPQKVKRGRPPKKQGKQQVCSKPMKSESNERKRAMVESLYDDPKARSSIMERAYEVQANLDPELPSLVKTMLHSHVCVGFWLGLPKKFCDSYLPKQDSMMVLEDESGEVCEAKYLAEKVGLSGGWRAFSLAHKLVEGDVVVFHLVSPLKFKVYIVRSNCSDEVDCALGLLKLEANMKQETKSLEPLLLDNPVNNIQMTISSASDQSDKDSDDIRPEVLDGLRLSESVISFEEVRNIGDFNILINGLIINSELPKCFLAKYYELCCSQKTYLHEHFLEGLNCKLVVGVISETINIADGIRASKLTSSVDDFATWDKTLKAFEGLGMNVGFLRARLDQLASLASKSKRYENVRVDREELRDLEAKISVVKEKMIRLSTELEALGTNSQELQLMFQEVASASW